MNPFITYLDGGNKRHELHIGIEIQHQLNMGIVRAKGGDQNISAEIKSLPVTENKLLLSRYASKSYESD